jgi:hypothetical protein
VAQQLEDAQLLERGGHHLAYGIAQDEADQYQGREQEEERQ